MSTKIKAMDEILSRWFRDGQFRQQLRDDPEQALAGYDLTPAQRARLFKFKKQTRQAPASDSVGHKHTFSLN